MANAAKETRMAAAITREAAPTYTLGSQSNEKPLVSKDELIEGSNIKISEQDQLASHNAVMATLNKIKGIKPVSRAPIVEQPMQSILS